MFLKTPKEERKRRFAALRKAMAAKEADYFVTGAASRDDGRGNVRYFTDYDIPCFEEYLVIPAEGKAVFFAHDGGTAAAVRAWSEGQEDEFLPEVRMIPAEEYNTAPGACVGRFLKEQAEKAGRSGRKIRAGLCGLAGLSALFADSLRAEAGGVSFVDMDAGMQAIRMLKSPYEMELSRAAIRLNEENFAYYVSRIREGKREIEVLEEASSHAFSLGAERLFFLAGTGRCPVCRPVPLLRLQNHVFASGDLHAVVLEHSAPGGHYSEISRHISLGEPDAEVRAAYAALTQAQEAAFAAMKPGNTVGNVAREAERALKETPFGAWMNEAPPAAMGHSQGLDVWEFPRIISTDETPLLPGLRLNLHPAAGLKDGGRVSFCDLYVITENGAEKLSALPDEMIQL